MNHTNSLLIQIPYYLSVCFLFFLPLLSETLAPSFFFKRWNTVFLLQSLVWLLLSGLWQLRTLFAPNFPIIFLAPLSLTLIYPLFTGGKWSFLQKTLTAFSSFTHRNPLNHLTVLGPIILLLLSPFVFWQQFLILVMHYILGCIYILSFSNRGPVAFLGYQEGIYYRLWIIFAITIFLEFLQKTLSYLSFS